MMLRLTGRRDGVLLAGLALAILTVFDQSIAWLVEMAHDVELSYGIRLLPALVVLTGIFMGHLHAKRQESKAEAAAADLRERVAQERLRELERLHQFGRQLAGALSLEAIQAALWRHLPVLTEDREAWVAIWAGDRVDIVVDTVARSPEHLAERTRTLLDLWRRGEHRDTTCHGDGDCRFLLLVGGDPIGVLGVDDRREPLGPGTERVLAAASALIASTIRNVQLFEELRETAVTDSLTGCVNRAHFLDLMSAELRRSRRTGSPVSVLLIDLDGFKLVNDHDGHLAGDQALATIGRRLKDLLRHSDVRCRYGGDEFLVMLPDTPLPGALHVADVLRREIGALQIRASGRGVVTASVGVAAALPGEIDPVFCIERADRGVYAAKRAGGNRAAVHDGSTAPIGNAGLAKSA